MVQATRAAVDGFEGGEFYSEAWINGVEYRTESLAITQYCNHLVHSVDGFWVIIAIVSYVIDGQTHQGIVGRKLHVNPAPETFGTDHIKQIIPGDQIILEFVDVADILAPAMIITIEIGNNHQELVRENYIVPLANCWESD